ncbi:MAG: TrbG/VirB9 family P-type conjugative transfer protein [Alphaproteobacteria bacterium]|nr:TrbG/VirB9 family P-type conjugative transfer protein [Alphaproteobacteria bacterium]MBN2675486.1 TrbG/VirB9 family P-type conjugative transfer protein [Alphaproteobacteria bacterium]
MIFSKILKVNLSIFCLLTLAVMPNNLFAEGIQEAWDNPNANMASGSTKPGYAQLTWVSGSVLPVKLRNGMVTMVNLPAGEQIEDGVVGNQDLFDFDPQKNGRSMYITPAGSNQGADTNLIVTGKSGNKYIFYLRSEPANSSEITYSQVDIVLDSNSSLPVANSSSSQSAGMNSIFKKVSTSSSVVGVDGEDYGWIKSMKIDPSEFRFDLDIFVPNPDDYVIAPERVWRDRIFTYIDFGDKVIAMTQRPVVSLLVEGGESPVGFRTDGENGRLLIIEAVGDMVLRSGQRIVCIKKREKPFLIADTASVMALAEANVAQSMTSTQSLNNVAYSNTGTMVSSNGYGVAPTMNYAASGVATNYGSSTSGVNMLPTQRNTAGSYLPQTGIPLISSNQTGVAVELKSDTSVKALNDYWTGLLAKFSGEDGKGILTPYKGMVFFAVDEQGVGELGSDSATARLYRLRIGPMSDIDNAQKLCDQMLKFSGTSCHVVRIQ